MRSELLIDGHSHAGYPDIANKLRRFIPFEQNISVFKQKLVASGVEGAIVFPFPNTYYYNPERHNRDRSLVVSGSQEYPYKVENSELLTQCATENSFYPFVCVAPNKEPEKQLKKLEGYMERKRKIFGLKFHGQAVQTSPEYLISGGFVDFAEKYDIPIMFHSGVDKYSLPEHALSIAKRNPRLRICIAHFAQFRQEIISEISKNKNVFIDCSPLTYLQEVSKKGSRWVQEPNLISSVSPELTLLNYYKYLDTQLMWGTDEPWTRMVTPDGIVQSNHDYGEEVEIIKKLRRLNTEAVRNIANNNTFRFLFG